MNFVPSDDRGVSTVIGFVLIFALLVISFSVYQASIIPNQNKKIEFNHFEGLESDMLEIDDSVSSTNYREPSTVKIRSSQEYPARIVGVNPPPFNTDISFGSEGTVTISNFQIESEGNEEEYWNVVSQISVPVSVLNVNPEYRVLESETGYAYENRVIYTSSTGGNVPVQSNSPIDDTDIRIRTLTGNIESNQQAVRSINIESVSASGRSLYITGQDSSTPITLEFSTELSEQRWKTILQTWESPQIQSVSKNSGTLVVDLDPQYTYSVDIGVSAINPSTQTEQISDPTYITSNYRYGVISGQAIDLTVHDSIGNTVEGATVTVSQDNDNCISRDSSITNSEGKVTFTCNIPNQGSTNVEFQINDGSEDYEDTVIQVNDSGNGNNGNGNNGNGNNGNGNNGNGNGGPPGN